ncbi:hypothetical protein pb186bvf_004318 [Paramecium bursaria]
MYKFITLMRHTFVVNKPVFQKIQNMENVTKPLINHIQNYKDHQKHNFITYIKLLNDTTYSQKHGVHSSELLILLEGLKPKQDHDYQQLNTKQFMHFIINGNKLLKETEATQEQKIQFQRIVYQVLLWKLDELNLNNIFTLMKNNLKLKFQGRIPSDYLDLCKQVSAAVTERITKLSNTEQKEEFLHPDFFISFAQFLKNNQSGNLQSFKILEEQYLKQVGFTVLKPYLKLNIIMLNHIQKYGLGEEIFQRIVATDLKEFNVIGPSFYAQVLQMLLYHQVGNKILRKYGDKITKADLLSIINQGQKQFETKVIDFLVEKVNQLPEDQLSNSQKHQILSSDYILSVFNYPLKLKTYAVDQQEILFSNELNYDIEQYLISKGIKYQLEYQHGPFLCDFYLPELNIIIESDGSFHQDEQNTQNTQSIIRDFCCIAKGYKLISVNWFKQTESRHQPDNQNQYLDYLFDQIKNEETLLIR